MICPHKYIHTCIHTVFAGAWPHIKSLTSLLCWVLDGKRLGRDARRALLTLAYVLQKLSHVETFVLVRVCVGEGRMQMHTVNRFMDCILINVFHFLAPPHQVILMTGGSLKAHLPEHDDWGVRSVIRPQAGFYCFLTGLCCSMFLSRVALHYDYLATAAFEEREEEEQEEAENQAAAAALLGDGGEGKQAAEEEEGGGIEEEDEDEEDGSSIASSASAAVKHSSSPRKRRGSSSHCSSSCIIPAFLQRVATTIGAPSGSAWLDLGTPYFLLGLLAFFAVGLATPCFAFHYQGLAGWVLSHVTENWPDVSPPTKTSTVLSLGLGVPSATDHPDDFGVRYLQAAFLFFVVAAPLGCLVLLLALTVLPVRTSGKLFLTAAEVRGEGKTGGTVVCVMMTSGSIPARYNKRTLYTHAPHTTGAVRLERPGRALRVHGHGLL